MSGSRMRWLALFGALIVFAPEGAEAQRRRPDLHRFQESLRAISERLGAGASREEVLPEITRLYSEQRGRVERLRAGLARAERILEEKGLSGAASERLALARASFESSHAALLAGLQRLLAQPDLAESEECLRILAPLARASEEDILSAQDLPLRAPALAAPPLVKSGLADTAALAAAPAAVIGPVPPALRELADTLDGAVAAYELVKNGTRFELYHGSMKGAEQTWREDRGNDADINAFLVALLRAEGVPARFVRGVIRLPVETAMNLFGVDRPERVEQALSAAAVPYEPVLGGGGLTAVELEHVWVEAFVPYSNYRGTGLDDQGKRWVPLDASFKVNTVQEGFPVLEAMGFDAETFVRESLAADPVANPDPLEILRQRVVQYLNENQPGMSFEAALRRVEPTPEVFGLLPASLPYDVVSVNGVFFDFPENLEHQIRFRAKDAEGATLLDVSFPASRLLGRRLTLSYVPATPSDREIADGFGGLYKTPPYLVHVAPVLRSAGLVVATGQPVGMGMPFQLAVEFQSPAGGLSFENRMIAGAFAAMALSGRGPTFSESSETRAGEMLSQRALEYLERWNRADDDLAGLTRVVNLRPVPSHVMVKNHIEVDYAAEAGLVPLTFEWSGIDVDADLRPSAPVVAGEGDGARRDFFLLSGMVGSDLESRILEDAWPIPSVATLRLLRWARALGVEIKEIDSGNARDVLPQISIEPALKATIEAHVYRGRRVFAPASDVALLAWRGAGFVSLDPETGESAYILSGVIGGGSTTADPNDIPASIRDPLADPEESREEPSRVAAAVAKVPETDFQEARVTGELDLPLTVWVTDQDGNPVADGVPVTFRALEEGSKLASLDTSEQGDRITVPTEGGFARARFVVGASTRLQPRFIKEKETDEWKTQVGLYTVTADVGSVSLAEPFVAFAFPDAGEAQLRLVSGRYSLSPPLVANPVPLWVQAVEKFGNPRSNVEVEFAVGTPERFGPGPLPTEYTNATIGGRDSARSLTGAGGIFAFVRMGDVDATHYRITARLVDGGGEPVEFTRDTPDLGTDTFIAPIGERLIILFRENGLRLPSGEHLWPGRAGAFLPGLIEYTLVALQETYEVAGDKLVGTGRFTRREVTEGVVEPVLLEGTGVFEPQATEVPGEYHFRLLLGPEPGRRRIDSRVTAKLRRPKVVGGQVVFDEFTITREPTGLGEPVWGASVRVMSQEPTPIFLDGNGHVEPGTRIHYEILPAEVDQMLRSMTQGRLLRIYQDNLLYLFNDPPPSPIEISPAVFFDRNRIYEVELALLADTPFQVLSERRRVGIFNARVTGTLPQPILVREDPEQPDKFRTARSSALQYFVEPSPRQWASARVHVIETDQETGAERVTALEGNNTQGEGEAILASDFPVDLAQKEYGAELVLKEEGGQERRSARVPVPFSRLLYEVSPLVRLEFESSPIDRGRTCFRPARITYRLALTADVLVTAIVEDEEHVLFRGRKEPSGDEPHVLWVDNFAVFPIRSAAYQFRIFAVTPDQKLGDESRGQINVEAASHVVLPVGRTFVKGVDLLDGHLVASSTDVRIPGRGTALEVVRTYASAGAANEGPLGRGWNLNYLSNLIITDCFYTIVGGDGSGQRFIRDEVTGLLRPQKGYHTTLVENPSEGSFDFFTKGRVRYHYVDVPRFEGERLFGGGRPTLQFIEDPNGNRMQLLYDPDGKLIEAREVFQGGLTGRSLFFTYKSVLGVPRILRITGPLGLEINYKYDAFANLIEVTRDERVERYEYGISNIQDRHNLIAYTDPNGNRTEYVYYREEDVFAGETPDPFARGKFEWVREVREPEGVTTSFVYDVTRVPLGEHVARVTDARGHETVYTLNANGSPLRIEEPGPAGPVVTTMKWAADDIFKEEEVDAKGRLTRFRYDTNANLIEERLVTELGEVVTSFEYDPIFNKMTLKQDALRRKTRFAIDPANGNLRSVTDADKKTTQYDYFENGDLKLVQDPRSGVTRYLDYDPFGNPSLIEDPEGNQITRSYDERSRLRSSTDTIGHAMTQEFDSLDRLRVARRTDAKLSSAEEVITRTYYPAGQVKTETNGLLLTTEFLLDHLNRVVRTEDTLGLVTVTKYDGNGNVTAKTDRRGVTTVNTYDALNRLVKVEVRGPAGPAQLVSEYGYDDVGNKLFETDVHRHRTEFEYDGLYRVKTRNLPTGHTESFVYDLVGNKLEERDANNQPTFYTYDKLNRLASRVDAVGNRMEYAYDANGNRTLEHDATRGLKTETTYDLLNRPKTRTVSSSADGFSYLTTFDYDDPAHKVVETDPRSFKKTTELDGFDRVHTVTQQTGTEELITKSFYDANGNLSRTVDANNHETRFTYDGLNRLKRVDYPIAPLVSEYDYDGEGNRTKELNRRGIETRLRYDNLGRLIQTEVVSSVTGVPSVRRVAYDDARSRRIETDARNNPTTYEMDGQERVVKITDPLGKVQTFEYDGVNKRKETDKRSFETRFEYDAINRLVKVTDPLLQTLTTEYRDALRQVVETDKRSLRKVTQLDALGRTVSVTRSGVVLEQHEYDPNNNRTQSTDANGNRTRFDYDGASRLVARTEGFGTPDAATTSFTYDRVGNLLTEKDARVTGKPFDVKNTYDELNRLTEVEDAEDNLTKYEYDGEGNRTAQVEPEGNRTEYDYGELNELIEVRMADLGAFSYRYDANRNRVEQLDGNGNKVSFAYDPLNRMTQMTQDPGVGRLNLVTSHEYDANGNESRMFDPKLQQTTFEYDRLNRMTARVYALTPADMALFTRTHRIDYSYDPNNNLIRVDETRSSGNDPPAVFSNLKTYDNLDRLKTETDNIGRVLTFGYDPQGNRTSLIDPDSKQTTYTYDALNRLKTLITDGGTTTYEYFPDGLKQTVTNPNGTASTFAYDSADRLTTIEHKAGAPTISAYAYTYDRNGNRTRQVETNAGRTEETTYTYDPVNRLKTVTYPDRTTAYEYDKSGNRTRELTTGAEASDKTFVYDAVNRLTRSEDTGTRAELSRYAYDANGNTTSKLAGGVETRFLFDIRNQLSEVQTWQGAVQTATLGRYGYDYDGRRIFKIGAEGIRRYTYDQRSVITEADQAGVTVSKYDYGLDQLVRLNHRNEGKSFFHLDALGSTVNLTNDAGAARESIFYNAWGQERDRIGASANHFTFTGHEIDRETGLFYAKARFYDPEIGRFLSQDSFLGDVNEPPSLHRYFYANANPLRFSDPTGFQSHEVGQKTPNRFAELDAAVDEYVKSGGKLDPTLPLPWERNAPVAKVADEETWWDRLKAFSAPVVERVEERLEEAYAPVREAKEKIVAWASEQLGIFADETLPAPAKRTAYVEEQLEAVRPQLEASGLEKRNISEEFREFEVEFAQKAGEKTTRLALEIAEAEAGGRLLSGVVALGGRGLTAASARGGVRTGGRAPVQAGRAGEEAVSTEIGIPRNVGPGRATIPGTGRGGFRIPDFPPQVTIELRGSVVEVKNVERLSITPQLRDLAAYANGQGAVVEIFTNAPGPLRGELADLIQAGIVTLRPIPR